jgi:hypothetical protein
MPSLIDFLIAEFIGSLATTHISSDASRRGKSFRGYTGGISQAVQDKRLIVLLASLYCVVVAKPVLEIHTGLFSSGWISANGGSGHAQAVTELLFHTDRLIQAR